MKRIATTLLLAGLFATPMLALPPPAVAGVSVGISIGIAPPPLPVYVQPVVPGPGYLWTPGYWAWGGEGYYWVPGTWVMPPEIGLLWTPGWWGWSSGYYRWHSGYWGQRVGFYGGINYGFGYFGVGYTGGYWRDRHFYYNRSVNHIDVNRIRNVYVNRTVINNVHVNRVSYNGGHGGVMSRPTAAQRGAVSERHWSATTTQTRQRETAMRNPAQRFKTNRGRPAVVATQHPDKFDAPHAVRAANVPQGNATRPADRNGHFVRAPHTRAAASQRNQRVPASATPNRPERAPATAPRPSMERGRQNARPQREMQREQRVVPNQIRQSPRSERAKPRHAPPARGQRAKKHPPPSSGGY